MLLGVCLCDGNLLSANKGRNQFKTCFENQMQFNKTRIYRTNTFHVSICRGDHVRHFVHLFTSSHLQSISGPLKKMKSQYETLSLLCCIALHAHSVAVFCTRFLVEIHCDFRFEDSDVCHIQIEMMNFILIPSQMQ